MTEADYAYLEQPSDPNVRIWRYMDLGKFVWLLQREALYFSRSDRLGDQYEGYYTQADARAIHAHIDSFYGRLRSCSPSTEMLMIEGEKKRIFEFLRKARFGFFVSCWHMNENESPAMWKLYTTHNEAICITSTYARLRQILPNTAHLGAVRYIDYVTDIVDPEPWGSGYYGTLPLRLIMHKRRSYAHEREARAVVQSTGKTVIRNIEKPTDESCIVPVDLSRMLDEVYISPSSSPMFREIVEGLIEKYKLKIPVRSSEVDAPPAY